MTGKYAWSAGAPEPPAPEPLDRPVSDIYTLVEEALLVYLNLSYEEQYPVIAVLCLNRCLHSATALARGKIVSLTNVRDEETVNAYLEKFPPPSKPRGSQLCLALIEIGRGGSTVQHPFFFIPPYTRPVSRVSDMTPEFMISQSAYNRPSTLRVLFRAVAHRVRTTSGLNKCNQSFMDDMYRMLTACCGRIQTLDEFSWGHLYKQFTHLQPLRADQIDLWGLPFPMGNDAQAKAAIEDILGTHLCPLPCTTLKLSPAACQLFSSFLCRFNVTELHIPVDEAHAFLPRIPVDRLERLWLLSSELYKKDTIKSLFNVLKDRGRVLRKTKALTISDKHEFDLLEHRPRLKGSMSRLLNVLPHVVPELNTLKLMNVASFADAVPLAKAWIKKSYLPLLRKVTFEHFNVHTLTMLVHNDSSCLLSQLEVLECNWQHYFDDVVHISNRTIAQVCALLGMRFPKLWVHIGEEDDDDDVGENCGSGEDPETSDDEAIQLDDGAPFADVPWHKKWSDEREFFLHIKRAVRALGAQAEAQAGAQAEAQAGAQETNE